METEGGKGATWGGKSVAWEADSVDGKSSWDLLLEWLKEGCYDRWANEPGAKGAICADFVAMLKARGNHCRSAATTFTKIWNIEKSVAHCKHWLEEGGHDGVETLESCGEQLKRKVLRHCPHFEQLAPIMKDLKSSPLPSPSSKKARERSPAGERPKKVKRLSLQGDLVSNTVVKTPSNGVKLPSNGNGMYSASATGSSTGAEQSSTAIMETPSVSKQSSRGVQEPLTRTNELPAQDSEALQGVDQASNGSDVASQRETPANNADEPSTTVEQPTNGANEPFVEVVEPPQEDDAEMEPEKTASIIPQVVNAGPLLQRELAARCVQFEQHNERTRIEIESERKKRDMELDTMRMKHESELQAFRKKLEMDVECAREKCNIDLEQAKCALQFTRDVNASNLAMERALSRQKMLKAGISQEEVDRILPSKACSS